MNYIDNTAAASSDMAITTFVASNNRAQQDILPDVVEQHIAEAKRFYTASKDNAAGAVANCYMVWRDTFGPGADKLLRDWINKKIEARNDEIEKENEKIRDDAALDKKAKARLRLSKIKARNGASQFAVIVKFVFDFVEQSDASMVSRYSTILDWVDAQIGSQVVQCADEVAELIKNAGNMEKIIRAQRGHGPTMSADARVAIAAAITDKVKGAVNVADAKSVCDLALECEEGLVVLLGRYDGKTVEVVSDRKLADGELNDWIKRFSDDIVVKVDEKTEFVSRVLYLGGLVAEGAVTELTRHGTTSGERLKEERVVTLLPHAAGGVEMVVSARHTEASVVIKARVKAPRIDMGTVTEPIMLDAGKRATLDNLLRERGLRSLITIDPVNDHDGIGWVAVNSALNVKQGAETRVNWTPLADEEHKPLAVDGFNARFSVEVSRETLNQLYDVSLKEWEDVTEKQAKDKPKLVTLTFQGNSMVYNCDGQAAQMLSVNGKARNLSVLRFRPRDLVQLVAKLLKCKDVNLFSFFGDDAGMLQINWADDLGDYTVCQPTSGTDGRLVYRRIAPMHVDAEGNNDDQGDEFAA